MNVDYEALLKSYKRKPLAAIEGLSHRISFDQTHIKRIIPQRDPILYVDELIALDLARGILAGRRRIDAADPVFRGHFPGFPVYPGSYTVEMIGQLGLCLNYFTERNTTVIDAAARPIMLRATRIIGALFLEPILPGHVVTLFAKKLEFDGFLGTGIGQAIVDGKIACVCVCEVAFLQ
jgi:3-hydroxyacyl-[acyl-carrier-protein] dehydratase